MRNEFLGILRKESQDILHNWLHPNQSNTPSTSERTVELTSRKDFDIDSDNNDNRITNDNESDHDSSSEEEDTDALLVHYNHKYIIHSFFCYRYCFDFFPIHLICIIF